MTNRWVWSVLRGQLFRSSHQKNIKKLYFSVMDHFEPFWRNPRDETLARQRVAKWLDEFPKLADHHRDTHGRPVQHVFFYPEEEYRKDILDEIASLCKSGYGDVEIHLHHDRDTADNLTSLINRYKETLYVQHGMLRTNGKGEIVYAFIHGNWALDNSNPDGSGCGINNEITVLKETGCYADFTFPSAPHPTQPAMVNTIYFANDDPDRPKSHNRGIPVTRNGGQSGDLLMVPGILGFYFGHRKYHVFPRLENSALSYHPVPIRERVKFWFDHAVTIPGEPGVGFVKLHTHGCSEKDMPYNLGDEAKMMYEEVLLEAERRNMEIYFVTAFEMVQVIKEIGNLV